MSIEFPRFKDSSSVKCIRLDYLFVARVVIVDHLVELLIPVLQSDDHDDEGNKEAIPCGITALAVYLQFRLLAENVQFEKEPCQSASI